MTTNNPTPTQPETLEMPERIYVPISGARLMAVSPELQNVEGAWYALESTRAPSEEQLSAPERVKLWICCRCRTPRMVGLTVCERCGMRLHDTVEYVRAAVAGPRGDELLSQMWQALIRETCINPTTAKTVVFLGEEKFRKALAPFAAATASPTPAEMSDAGIERLLTSLKRPCGCTDHDPEVCLEGEVDEGQRYCHCDCHVSTAPAERTRVEGEQAWKCACGWRGTPSQMTTSNTLRTCPRCGGSGGLILDTAPSDSARRAAEWKDEGGHAWEIRPNVDSVECPHCCFTFAAVHTDGYGNGYSCPNCKGCPDAAAPADNDAESLLPELTAVFVTNAIRVHTLSNHGCKWHDCLADVCYNNKELIQRAQGEQPTTTTKGDR